MTWEESDGDGLQLTAASEHDTDDGDVAPVGWDVLDQPRPGWPALYTALGVSPDTDGATIGAAARRARAAVERHADDPTLALRGVERAEQVLGCDRRRALYDLGCGAWTDRDADAEATLDAFDAQTVPAAADPEHRSRVAAAQRDLRIWLARWTIGVLRNARCEQLSRGEDRWTAVVVLFSTAVFFLVHWAWVAQVPHPMLGIDDGERLLWGLYSRSTSWEWWNVPLLALAGAVVGAIAGTGCCQRVNGARFGGVRVAGYAGVLVIALPVGPIAASRWWGWLVALPVAVVVWQIERRWGREVKLRGALPLDEPQVARAAARLRAQVAVAWRVPISALQPVLHERQQYAHWADERLAKLGPGRAERHLGRRGLVCLPPGEQTPSVRQVFADNPHGGC